VGGSNRITLIAVLVEGYKMHAAAGENRNNGRFSGQ